MHCLWHSHKCDNVFHAAIVCNVQKTFSAMLTSVLMHVVVFVGWSFSTLSILIYYFSRCPCFGRMLRINNLNSKNECPPPMKRYSIRQVVCLRSSENPPISYFHIHMIWPSVWSPLPWMVYHISVFDTAMISVDLERLFDIGIQGEDGSSG